MKLGVRDRQKVNKLIYRRVRRCEKQQYVLARPRPRFSRKTRVYVRAECHGLSLIPYVAGASHCWQVNRSRTSGSLHERLNNHLKSAICIS